MNKDLVLIQDLACVLGISIATFESVLSIIFCAISIALGLVNLFITIKKAVSDGKITAEEKKEIEEKIEQINKEIHNEKHNDN